MIVKLQWKQKKSTEAQFDVDVPDFFTQAFVMEKDSKRFLTTGGWGYAVINYDVRVGQVLCRCLKPRGLRKHLPHGGEVEGLHLPSVREALTAPGRDKGRS